MAIGTLLEKLFVSIQADLSGLKEELSDAGKEVRKSTENISRQFESVGRSMQKVGAQTAKLGASLTAGVTTPLVIGLGKSLKAWDQQEQAIAQVEAALKSTSSVAGKTLGELELQASALQNNSLFGDEDILQNLTSNLLTFTSIHGQVFDDAQQAILDYSQRLGVDLKSATLQVGKALNDPAKGISALSRAGVQFTESQKDMIESLQETGKTAEAQRIILNELEKQFGGSAKAAAEAGLGSFKQFQMALGDLQEEFGGIAIEMMPIFLEVARDVKNFIQSLSDETKKYIVIATGLAAALGPVLVGFGLVVSTLGALIKLAPVLLTAGKIIGTAIAIAGGPITAIIAAIGALVAAYFMFKDDIDAALIAAYESVKSFVTETISAFIELNTKASKAIVELVSGIKAWLIDKFNDIVDSVVGKIQAIGDKFAWLYDKVVGNSWVPDMVDEIGDHFNRLDDLMVSPTEDAANKVSSEFEALGQTINDHLQNFLDTGKFSFGSFIEDLNDKLLSDALQTFSDSLTNILDDFMSNMFSGIGKSFAGATGGGGGLFGTLGNIFGGLFGGFRAGGGIVPPWKSFVAGERGAEMVDQDGPAGARRVTPAGRTARLLNAAGGGSSVSVVFNMPQGTNMEEFRRSEGQISSTISKAVDRSRRNR